MKTSQKKNPWFNWQVLVIFLASGLVIAAWLPFFAQRSFWEEWGPDWMDGGIELIPSTFSDVFESSYLTVSNGILNIGLLVLYSVVATLILQGLFLLFRKVFAKR